jgi:hypothetical protein
MGGRRDGLWRRTCFEAFLRGAVADSYVEFNFSPSGAWAAYRFDRHRTGMRPLAVVEDPQLQCRRLEQSLELRAAIEPESTAIAWSGSLKLGFAAVIEGRDGSFGYWALRHPPGPPDFHHPESFTLHLDTSVKTD